MVRSESTEVRLTSREPSKADGPPRYRAGNVLDFLAFLEIAHPGVRAHLRGTLGAEVLEAIEGCARTGWIPIELDGQRVTEIVRYLGHDRAREAWRRFTSSSLIRSPAMRAISDGIVRVFGRSMSTCLKSIPLMFEQSWRDCGRVELEHGRREATVRIVAMPPDLARYTAYAVLFEGVFLGLYDIMKIEPRLEYRPALASGRIHARFRW